jgi:hypothetical protein
VGVQERAELQAGCGLGRHMIVAQPDEGLQLAADRIWWLQPAQPVAVGAQVVGQLVAVARVGLGAGGAPARPGGVERARVDRDDRVPGGQQPGDDEALAALDRHRQVGGAAVGGEPGQDRVQILLGVAHSPAVHDRAAGIDDGYGMAGAGRPAPTSSQR